MRFFITIILQYPLPYISKISALRGNSSWEIMYLVGPFICVLDILVGLFTHILIYLFVGLIDFHMDAVGA